MRAAKEGMKLLYLLKHLFFGNRCTKCEKCIWMDRSKASFYDGMELCEHHHPHITRGKYNQIIDCQEAQGEWAARRKWGCHQ